MGQKTTSREKATEREIRLYESQVEIENTATFEGVIGRGARAIGARKGKGKGSARDKGAEGGWKWNGKEGNCRLDTYYQRNEWTDE